jgi:mannose-1-phosphate guanylyltransferase
MRRNTAPCVAYATYKLFKKNPNARVVVTPADHAISNEIAFLEVIRNGLEFAGINESLVTIGLRPLRPETGYGYIQINKNEKNLCRDSICKVKTFTEKPNMETAVLFVQSGEFYWNSGIFIWSVSSIKKALETHLREVAELFAQGISEYDTSGEAVFIQDTYSKCPNISIDYGIMEKADNVYVFGADFGWSDVGTWNSLYHQLEKDTENNAVKGKPVFLRNVTNCMINSSSESKLLVIKDLDNFMVVDTDDVLMICPRDEENLIKQFVTDVLAESGKDFA